MLLAFPNAQNLAFSKKRICKSDRVYHLLEQLFIISGEVSPPDDMPLTNDNAKVLLKRWRQWHHQPSAEQEVYPNELEQYLNSDQVKANIDLRLGVGE